METGSSHNSAELRLLESLYRQLCDQDINSEKFAADLRYVLASNDYEEFSSSLPEPEVIRLIELLDNAQNSKFVAAEIDLRRKFLRQLAWICAKNTKLPSSHLIRHDLLKIKSGRALAGGTYADVFKGEFENMLVAIKQFRMYEDRDISQLQKIFCTECVIWKSLSHQNVLPLLGVSDFSSGCPFMLSPLMENGNLLKYLSKHQERNRLELLLGVASGLEYLHSREVIHGDLKASNVVVNDDGRALLVDFGLSSIIRGQFSMNHSIPGKPSGTQRWMAPEMLDSDEAQPSKQADVYALSMVAMEVFTGKHPFSEIRINERVTRCVLEHNRRPDRPANADAFGLTDEVWKIMEDCWCTDPTSRLEISTVVNRLQTAAAPS